MKKKLITNRNLEDYLADTASEFVVDNTMILSPNVLDNLREKGIRIVYKTNINTNKLDVNILEEKIKDFLSKEYNFTDQGRIKEITNKVIKKIEMEG